MTIPMDLFPARDKMLDESWAKDTFKFCHLFCDNINYTSYNLNINDINTWIHKATTIVDKLRSDGMVEGEKHIIHICKLVFRLYMHGISQHKRMHSSTLMFMLR